MARYILIDNCSGYIWGDTTMKFDPHQYVLDAGWDFNSVEATAKQGVAERDQEIIREMAAEQDLSEDAAVDASAELLRWCKQRVAEKAA